MKLRTRAVVAGAVAAGAVAAVGVVLVVRAVRRRARRTLNAKMRRLMTEILQMRAEDFMAATNVDVSPFRKRIDKLDNKQLIALAALVQVGYFIKVSGIDPLHPSKDEIARAAQKFVVEERAAIKARDELLNELDTSDAHDALAAAFGVLSRE